MTGAGPPRFSQIRGGTGEIELEHHEQGRHTDVVRGFVHTRGGALREIRPDRRAEKPT